jgi:RNase P subunit RPR2
MNNHYKINKYLKELLPSLLQLLKDYEKSESQSQIDKKNNYNNKNKISLDENIKKKIEINCEKLEELNYER